MEEGVGADDIGLLGQSNAAFADGRIETFQTVEAAICQRLIDEGPKMLGRL